MPLVNFWKKFQFSSFDFCQNFDVRTFCSDWAYAEPRLFGELSKKFCIPKFSLWSYKMGSETVFSNFRLFLVKICILICYFWVIFENYSMPTLSIRDNDFSAHWAYKETFSSHSEHTPNKFSRMLSQLKNVNSFYMYCTSLLSILEITLSHLSIQGNDLNAGWAYPEMISSLTEQTRICLKVEYLGRIECDFQKSCVTGPWDHKDSVSAKKV